MPIFYWITPSSVDLVCAIFSSYAAPCGPGMQSIFPIMLLLLLYAFFHYPHLISPGYPGQESSVPVSS